MTKIISKKIDHTLLKADAREEEISRLCAEAIEYDFATVCINPCNVPQAFHLLEGSGVGITTVVGFPLGASTTTSKCFEAEEAVKFGASEIDMVINLGALKDEKYEFVVHDIESLVDSVKAIKPGVLVKVILETSLLEEEQIVKACQLAVEAGADFVKTSTGFSEGGATTEVVSLMRKTVGKEVGVKASGGIRTYEDFDRMVKSGASRIGSSASIAIVKDSQ